MKKNSAKFMVEDVIGCKWSLSVLGMVKQGINRPGQMTRSQEGLTTKVLNERLRKLVRYEILEKKTFPEIPPRVEYVLTKYGKRFVKVIDEIEKLERDLE